jgi:PadR family transcriptional regulator PadR
MSEIIRARGTFLALLALKDGAKHGYEISAFIKSKSEGFFSLSFGALYPILHKLEKDGLARSTWQDVGETKQKKVYTLTAAGRKALESETIQYRAVLSAVAGLIGQTP